LAKLNRRKDVQHILAIHNVDPESDKKFLSKNLIKAYKEDSNNRTIDGIRNFGAIKFQNIPND